MKRRIYAAVNADIDRDGLKSAIRALFDDVTRKNNISGYTIKSLHLDKTGVRNPKCTCTIEYDLEGYASSRYRGPEIELNVPVGVEIPEDYYLDDPNIEAEVISDDMSALSELNVLEDQARSTFEYLTEVAEGLARRYGLTIKCSRYPKTVEPGKRAYCHMKVTVVDADTKYTTNQESMQFNFLTIQSGQYKAKVYASIVNISGSFPKEFSKQTIDEEIESGFKKFKSELRDAETKLDFAQDTDAYVDELLQLIENLCESSGCVFESDDRRLVATDGTMNIEYLGNIICRITYADKSIEFWLSSYVDKPTDKVKKSIQSRIRRLKDTDTKPRAKKYEQEDLDW